MLRLHTSHVLGVFFFEPRDLHMELVDLVACVGCQTLDLLLQIADLFLQLLNGALKLLFGALCVALSGFQRGLKVSDFLLEVFDLPHLVIQVLLQLSLRALELSFQSVDLDLELLAV